METLPVFGLEDASVLRFVTNQRTALHPLQHSWLRLKRLSRITGLGKSLFHAGGSFFAGPPVWGALWAKPEVIHHGRAMEQSGAEKVEEKPPQPMAAAGGVSDEVDEMKALR